MLTQNQKQKKWNYVSNSESVWQYKGMKMEEWKECRLKDICDYGKDRIEVSTLDNSTYISTENMLPDRAGIATAATLPTGEYTPNFEIDDTLVSNIRPYFKKIWEATFAGGCSAILSPRNRHLIPKITNLR